MAEFKTLKLTDILIPERLRAVEEEQAIAIAKSMVEHGQITPIAVRATPAASAPYTLVAGAHRIRSAAINAWDEIDAIVVKADKAEALLLEISENLFRNELSVIDRAIFVQTYREVWEQKHGTIGRGGDQKSNRQVGGLIGQSVVDLIAEEAEKGFARDVADRLGISKRATERLDQIARNLHPSLRQRLRGTAAADNQSLLLKLARQEPGLQKKMTTALDRGSDVKSALSILSEPAVAPDRQTAVRGALVNKWSEADAASRAYFLDHIAGDLEAAGWSR